MSRVFNKVQSNVIYLDNNNTVYLYNNNGELAATGPIGSIVPNFTGPTGSIGPTGSQGEVQLYNVESITGSQVVDPNTRITMIGGGETHTLTTTGVTGGTLKYIVDDIYRDYSSVNRIANYSLDNSIYYNLGVGVNDRVRALTVDLQDNLYVGGFFTTAGGINTLKIAKWIPSGFNTGFWNSLGLGVGTIASTVNALSVDSQDNLYVGGDFTTAGGNSASRIAKWIPSGVNTGLWFPLGSGLGGVVTALSIDSQDNLYVGGNFIVAGGESANYIAKWIPSGVNTGLWFPLGVGVDNSILALTIDSQNNLYAGGEFSNAGGKSAIRIAKWIPSGVNTGLWFPLKSGVNSGVFSLTTDSQDNVYVGGNFTTAGGASANRIAKWVPTGNTGIWYPLSSGVSTTALALTVDQQDNLYCGGNFTTAGGITVNRIAKWVPSGVNNGNWMPVYNNGDQNGLNNTVYSLYYSSTGINSNNLLIGGDFTTLSTYTTSVTSRFINPVSGGVSYNLTTASSTYQGRSLELIYNERLSSWIIANGSSNNFSITL